MAWGSSFRSCDALISRIEQNDPILTDLIILPTKSFGETEIDRLSAVLVNGCNTHWRSLRASSHALSAVSLMKLGKAIAASKNRQLVELAIGHAEMGDEGVCALCEGLGDSNPLQKVDLSYKGMGIAGFLSIMSTLGRSIHLEQLNLSRNAGIGSSLEGISMSEKVLPRVRDLDLSGCNINGFFVDTLFARMEPYKRRIQLSNNPLGDAGFLVILTYLEWIEELLISGCEVGDESMRALISVKDSRSKEMKILDLSDNNITGQGASDLSSSLQSKLDAAGSSNWAGLCELNLARNALGTDGVQSIVAGLVQRKEAQLSNLATLDLSDTNCGVAGAVVAVSNSGVSTLRLFNNNLLSEGFRALAGTLQGGHPLICTLDLAGNKADQASVVELLSSLLVRDADFESRLHTLVIGGNETGDLVEECICRIKQIHPDLDIPRDKHRKAIN